MPLTREQWLGLIHSQGGKFIWRPGDVTILRPGAQVSLAFVRDYLRREHGNAEEVHGYERLEGAKAYSEAITHQATLDEPQWQSVQWYSTDGYQAINGLLRHGSLTDPGEENDACVAVRDLDSAFAAEPGITKPIAVWRGIGFGAGQELEPGAVVSDKAYVSTSTDKLMASMFDSKGGYLLHISVPAGTRVLTPPATEESEVVLPRDSSFRITKVGPEVDGPVDAFGYKTGIKVREAEAELLPAENVGAEAETKRVAKLSRQEWLDLIPPGVEDSVGLVANELTEHPMHVKTPSGAKFYKEPIGAVIFAKPHLKPGYEKTQKLVYVAGIPYAVPASAQVYVPPTVDLHQDAAVDESLKAVKLADGTAWLIKPDGTSEQASGAELAGVESAWHKLSYSQLKKPVLVHGGVAAWVPQDAKVYYSPKSGTFYAPGKWVKLPDGSWEVVQADGIHHTSPTVVPTPEVWVQKGEIVPEAPPGTGLPEDVHPPASAKPEFTPATVMVPPGIHVNQHQIADAITALKSAKSTNVKAPLKKIGSPLADMDYLAIAKSHAELHPGLAKSPGTKKAHVGHTKTAILHYLAEQQQKVALTDAHTQQALEAQEKAEAEAEHAKALTPAMVYVPVVKPGAKEVEPGDVIGVTKDQLADAVAKLQVEDLTSHKPMKTILGDNPLAKADYVGMAKAHKKAHPEDKKLSTKAAFWKHLEDLQHGAAAKDKDSGHDDAAELDHLIATGPGANIFYGDWSLHAQLASALLASHSIGHDVYVVPFGTGMWSMTTSVAGDQPDFYRATPQHIVYREDHGTVTAMGAGKVLSILKTRLAAAQAKQEVAKAKAADLAQEPAKPKFKVSPMAGLQLWKKYKKGELSGDSFTQQAGASPDSWLEGQTADLQGSLKAWAKAEENAQEPGAKQVSAMSLQELHQLEKATKYAKEHPGESVYVAQNGSGTAWYMATGDKPFAKQYYGVTTEWHDGNPRWWDGKSWHAVEGWTAGKQTAAQPDLSKQLADKLPLVINGETVGEFPAGTVVYRFPPEAGHTPGHWWAHSPDGEWYGGTGTNASKMPWKESYALKLIQDGTIVQSQVLGQKAAGREPEVPPALLKQLKHLPAAVPADAPWLSQLPGGQFVPDTLAVAKKNNLTYYLKKSGDGGWHALALLPPAPEQADKGYWEVKPGENPVYHPPGHASHAAAVEKELAAEQDTVSWGGKSVQVPAGTQVYVSSSVDPEVAGKRYLEYPDGTWHFADLSEENPELQDIGETGKVYLETGQIIPEAEAEEPESAAAKIHSQGVLDDLVKHSKFPGPVTEAKKQDYGWALAMALKWATNKAADRYLVNENGIWDVKSGQPEIGSAGAPGTAFTWVTPDRKVIGVDVFGHKTYGDPENILALVKPWLHSPSEPAFTEPGDLEKVKPPAKDEAEKLLTAYPSGSSLWQVTGEGPLKGALYVQKPGGHWYQTVPGANILAKDQGLVDGWASSGALKKVAVKDAVYGVGILGGKAKKPEPAKPQVPEKIAEQFAKLPSGSTLYDASAHYAPGLSKAQYWAKTPDGEWVHLFDNLDSNGVGSEMAESALAAGKLTDVTPSQAQAKPGTGVPEPPEDIVSMLPTGADLYYAAYPLSWEEEGVHWYARTVTTPAYWWAMGPGGGKTPYHAKTFYDASAASGELVKVPYAPEPITIKVGGKVAGNVPAGSKVYVLATSKGPVADAGKYVHLPDGSWQKTSPFSKKLIPVSKTTYDNLLEAGVFKEINPLEQDGGSLQGVLSEAAAGEKAKSELAHMSVKELAEKIYSQPGNSSGAAASLEVKLAKAIVQAYGGNQKLVKRATLMPGKYNAQDTTHQVAANYKGPYPAYLVKVGDDGQLDVSELGESSSSHLPLASVKDLLAPGMPGASYQETDVAISVGGQVVGHAPAGSSVYGLATNSSSDKWVKYPDGVWHVFNKFGEHVSSSQDANDASAAAADLGKDGGGLAHIAGPKISDLGGGAASSEELAGKIEAKVTSSAAKSGPQPLAVKLAQTMYLAKKNGGTYYVKQPLAVSQGSWTNTTQKPTSGDWYKISYSPSGWQVSQHHHALNLGTEIKDTDLASAQLLKLLGGEKQGEAPEPAKSVYVLPGTLSTAEVAVPKGAKVYTAPSYYGGANGKKLVLKKDGNWHEVNTYGTYSVSSSVQAHYTKQEKGGNLQEAFPATAQDLADLKSLTDLNTQLKTSAAEPGESAPTWQEAAARLLTGQAQTGWSGSDSGMVWKDAGGTWKLTVNTGSHEDSERYLISKDGMSAQHLAPEAKQSDGTSVPASEVLKVKDYLVPNAVVMAVGGKKTLLKYGYYYKPKGSAALEVVPASHSQVPHAYTKTYKYGLGAKAGYLYHSPSGGVSAKTPTFAADWLENAKYFGAESKSAAPAPGHAVHLTYLTKAEPGDYQVYGSNQVKATLHADGTALMHSAAGATSALITYQPLLKSGSLLDKYGTTVIQPGTAPEKYHLWHSLALSAAQLQDFREELQQHFDVAAEQKAIIQKYLPGAYTNSDANIAAKAFFNDHQATGFEGQRDALLGLLTELLTAPTMKAAAPVEVKYYKSLPPGLHTAKDVFDFTPAGYAHPFDGKWMPGQVNFQSEFNPYLLASGDLTKVIKDISDQFGGGKVVGQHPASMSKDEKASWLKAWRAGDMVKVFDLDATSGKVSPLHPGAPKNADTHKVTWAPWGEGQVSALKDIPVPEGMSAWSDPAYASQPEIANYLIKAGLQHAEYLDASERRKWVVAHTKHDQEQVDGLSRLAWQRWSDHESALTEPLTWTRDIKPAKSYTVLFEDKTPASGWTTEALSDFGKDHWDEIKPFAVTAPSASEFQNTSSYVQRDIVQHYLDDLDAKEEAERKRPKYHFVEGEAAPKGFSADQMLVADQYGHQFVFRQPEPETAKRELAAYTLARMWGFKSPPVQPITIEGTDITGLGQQYLPGTQTLDLDQIADLSADQAADLAAEHVLDWALDNWDGAPSNYLIYGKGVVGIDKDAAFSKTPGEWDGMGPGAGDFAKHTPSALYSAIRSHQVSQDTADGAYIAAVRAARRMSMLSDSRLGEILAAGDLSPQAITSLTARKNDLEDTVQHLWEGIYHDAGWKLPEVPKERLSHGLHSGFTEPSYFDHVMAAKSFGVPAFFGGHDLSQGNLLTWTELAGENRLVRGEGAILEGPALDKIVAWCKDHEQGVEKLHQGNSGVIEPAVPAAPGTYVVKGAGGGAGSWHFGIEEGAKAVSKVNAGGGGWTKDGGLPPAMNQTGYTAGQLKKFADAKAALLAAQADVENAVKDGDSSATWAAVAQKYGAPPSIVDQAVKYYLDQVGKVETAKTHAGTFQAGDLPEWAAPKIPKKAAKAAPPVPAASQVKVIKTGAVRDLAWNGTPDSSDWVLGKDDHELHLSGKTYAYKGNVWKITLPTGEVIEVNDSDETYTPPGQIGRIRFRADAGHGAQSLENIRAQLQDMGMELPEATDQDLELTYWRMMGHTLAGRPDRDEGKYAKVWDSLRSTLAEHDIKVPAGGTMAGLNKLATAASQLDPETEAEAWRKAWAQVAGQHKVDEWVEKKRYLPHLGHFDPTNPEVTSGKPFWYRVEADPGVIDKEWGNPVASDTGGAVPHVLRSGIMASTEARLRALGLWSDNTSSTTDMNSTGGGGVVYLRPASYGSLGLMDYVVSPRVQARLGTYSFSNDNYGSLSKRSSQSYFDLDKGRHQTTETLPPDALSVLDDLELIKVANSGLRAQIIKYYKDHGVSEVRGLPIEDRIVSSLSESAVKKARDAAVAGGTSWIDPPEQAYAPPPSDVVTHSIITTEATEKGAEEAAHGAAKAGTFKAAAAAPGASAATVNQVFYHMAGVDPESSDMAKRAQIKHETAERVASEMTVPDEQLASLAADAGLSAPASWGDTERARTVAAILGKWATGSTDPVIIALQQRAQAVFGEPENYYLPKVPPETMESAAQLIEDHSAVLDSLLTTMWELTQHDFSGAGADNVTLYRLFKFNPSDAPEWAKGVKAGDTIDAAPSYPFSAWALSPAAINSDIVWGSGSQSVLVKTTVPRQLLLSYPRSGFGSYLQGEVDVLNSAGKWQVVSGPGDSIAASLTTNSADQAVKLSMQEGEVWVGGDLAGTVSGWNMTVSTSSAGVLSSVSAGGAS